MLFTDCLKEILQVLFANISEPQGGLIPHGLGATLISDQLHRGRYDEHIHLGGLSPFAFLFVLSIDSCCSCLECQTAQTAQFGLWSSQADTRPTDYQPTSPSFPEIISRLYCNSRNLLYHLLQANRHPESRHRPQLLA